MGFGGNDELNGGGGKDMLDGGMPCMDTLRGGDGDDDAQGRLRR